MEAVTVDFKPIIDFTDEQFYKLCRSNPDVKFERNPMGELIIMPPTGGETGNINSALNAILWV
jgi:Uma2 family endonuclease